jgi:hypothetical protein
VISRSELASLVDAWDAAPDATHDPRARSMINAEVRRVKRAFAQLPIRVQFVDHDPYHSFEEMRDQVQSTGTMLVYKGESETPLWDPLTNWQARAVHDWDHIEHALDFSMEGEAAAYRHAAARTPELEPLYLSEVMLQAAIRNYTGAFVPQKLVLAPESIRRRARGMQGLGDTERFDPAVLATVWDAAGMLHYMSPEELIVHLRYMGFDLDQAIPMVDAAQMLHAQES